ncbi:ATP-binding protein [Amycolatopsis sp. NPDC049159]|uniref:ATP-binding protein n=1 Tax=Amycolatopsis sp. NPDC049159 TaxID=3157210 RepID=UPI0033FA6633
MNDPDTGTHNKIEKSTVSGQAVQANSIGSVHFGGTGAGAVALDRAIRDLVPILESVLERGFSGREWLIDRIDRFLERHRCGYVWIEAEAGMGKTALCAQLIRERAWIGHFARLNNGGLSRVGLQNLAGQLIAHHELSDFAPGRMMPEWTFTPEGFETVLSRAAEQARDAGKPLVLLVDGADEAETPEGMQPWGLPGLLPSGVFVVGTYRTGSPPPRCDAPRAVLSIHPTDAQNRDDVASYLGKALQEPELSARLAETGVLADAFAADAADRCGGVWVYLRYVLDEIRLGLRDPRELGELPADLPSYYTAQLTRWSREPSWHDGLLPLLATMAVVGEPLPPATLARLSGVAESSVRQWCHATLRPFLTASAPLPGENPAAGLRKFEIYHASMREVLTGARSGTAESEESWAWSEVLAPAARAAHRRIADQCLDLFGGLDAGLPALADDPGLGGADQGYALSHLARHLVAAGDWSDLHRLLRVEKATADDEAVNVWFAAHDRAGPLDGYLADLATARRECERRTDQSLAARRPAPSLADEMRYLLMGASITSLTNSVPGDLLVCLLEHGVWSWERALTHAHRLSTPRARAEALAAMIHALPENQRPDAARQGFGAAKIITKHHERAQALVSLAPHLPAGQLAEALATARSVPDNNVRAELLARLVPHVPAEQRPAVIAVALKATGAAARTIPVGLKVLSILAPHLPAEKFRELLGDRLDDSWNDLPEDVESDVLAALCPYLPTANLTRLAEDVLDSRLQVEEVLTSMERRRMVDHVGSERSERTRGKKLAALAAYFPDDKLTDAFAVARSIRQVDSRVEALLGLLPHLPANIRTRAVADILGATGSLHSPHRRVDALIRLTPHAPLGQRAEILTEALETVTKITYNDAYVRALTNLSPGLPVGQAGEILKAVPTISDETVRAEALATLGPQLSDEQRAGAVAAAGGIGDEKARASALAALAPCLSDRQLTEALFLAGEVSDSKAKADALAGLAPHLSESQLAGALSTAKSIPRVNARVHALIELAPHLRTPQRDAVLAAVREIPYPGVRARALAGLARRLPEHGRHTLLTEALSAAQAVSHESSRADAVAAMAPHLLSDQVATAWAMVEAIADGDARAKSVAALAPYLSPDQRLTAFEYALATPDNGERAAALTRVAPHLPCELRVTSFEAAVAAAQAIPNRGQRLRAFSVLAEHLPISTVSKALSATESAFSEGTVSRMLAALSPHLPADQVVKALQIVRTFTDEDCRAEALTAISPYLPIDHLIPAALAVPYGFAEPLHRQLERAGEGPDAAQPDEWVALLRTIFRSVDRNVFLELLKSSTGMLRSLAGPAAAGDLASAIRDTHRWWL